MVAMRPGWADAMDAVGNIDDAIEPLARIHCEVSVEVARMLGLDNATQTTLWNILETYDGRGKLHRLPGDRVPLPVFIISVAGDLEILTRVYGIERALVLIAKKGGASYPASLIHSVALLSEQWLRALDRTSPNEIEAALLTAGMRKATSFWESRLDIPRLMAECTNKFLAAARKKSKNIHALTDVHTYIMHHPVDDEYFRKALENSGYLTVWQKEYAKSPWHYDIDFMKHVGTTTENSHGQLTWYCQTTVEGTDDGRRYEVNSAKYALHARMTGSETFRLFANLYETLDRLHKQRVRVARQWLAENPSPALDEGGSS